MPCFSHPLAFSPSTGSQASMTIVAGTETKTKQNKQNKHNKTKQNKTPLHLAPASSKSIFYFYLLFFPFHLLQYSLSSSHLPSPQRDSASPSARGPCTSHSATPRQKGRLRERQRETDRHQDIYNPPPPSSLLPSFSLPFPLILSPPLKLPPTHRTSKSKSLLYQPPAPPLTPSPSISTCHSPPH
jgi:hypothetical protein